MNIYPLISLHDKNNVKINIYTPIFLHDKKHANITLFDAIQSLLVPNIFSFMLACSLLKCFYLTQ